MLLLNKIEELIKHGGFIHNFSIKEWESFSLCERFIVRVSFFLVIFLALIFLLSIGYCMIQQKNIREGLEVF